jgi:hypothetical protein
MNHADRLGVQVDQQQQALCQRRGRPAVRGHSYERANAAGCFSDAYSTVTWVKS